MSKRKGNEISLFGHFSAFDHDRTNTFPASGTHRAIAALSAVHQRRRGYYQFDPSLLRNSNHVVPPVRMVEKGKRQRLQLEPLEIGSATHHLRNVAA